MAPPQALTRSSSSFSPNMHRADKPFAAQAAHDALVQ